MSIITVAALFLMGSKYAKVELIPGPATTQATATRINNALVQCRSGPGNGSLILPSILSGEANTIVIVVNDLPTALYIYPAHGEKMNGTIDAPLAMGSGQVTIFMPILNSVGNPSTTDWHSATFG